MALGRIIATSAVAFLVLGCPHHRPSLPPPVEDVGGTVRAPRITGLEFLGEAELPRGLIFRETVVGGLSGITYDAARGRYYAISDDPGTRSPARFYTLRIDLGSDSLAPDGVVIEAVTTLRTHSGRPFERLVMDAEAITLTPRDTLLVSSEGNVREGVPPSLREFGLDGSELRRIPVPRRYLPRGGRSIGVRHNKAFESLCWDPTIGGFYLAVENALRQDGPAADLGEGSAARILRFDYRSGEVVAELLYPVEPVAEPPADDDGFRTNGLVELLAAGDGELLALERSFSEGAGNTIRLFAVSTRGATDLRKVRRLDGRRLATIEPVAKRLLLDLATLGLPLDNIEGLTFGAPLADGRPTLILVSDDNFNVAQRTQVLAFALETRPVTTAVPGGTAGR